MTFDGSAFALGVLACAAGLTVLFALTFGIAERAGKHSVVDVTWGAGFVVVALITCWFSTPEGDDERRFLITAMVVLWGVRLAWHIGRRNAGHGEDPRYEALLAKAAPAKRRAYAVKTIYLPQAVLVLFISLPVQVAQYDTDTVGAVAAVGILVWSVGLAFEALGDWQLKQFKANPANRGTIMDRGLWRYTRHPNYFGDACVWWGIWLVAAETGAGLFTVLSPIIMTIFLTKGSGARLTEKRMAGRPGFEEYVARTSGFFPLPPRRSASRRG
ncbi:MAG: DUF1295 domain-containing protein [Sporichthyaceae bacterium]